jgi:hypothetical protein
VILGRVSLKGEKRMSQSKRSEEMKTESLKNLPLTIVMILISAATSFAVVQTKVSTLEKATDKSEATLEELKTSKAKQEVINDNIEGMVAETRGDVKEILKALKKR